MSCRIRVYYEDTDLSGVVYHANYLRYMERGRTEFFRLAGVSKMARLDERRAHRLDAAQGRRSNISRPARLDDHDRGPHRPDRRSPARACRPIQRIYCGRHFAGRRADRGLHHHVDGQAAPHSARTCAKLLRLSFLKQRLNVCTPKFGQV